MSFEDWFYEQEGFGLRADRFFEDECERDMQLFINMKKWLEAAYEAVQQKREWVGLTKEELQYLCVNSYQTDNAGETHFNRGYFADAIEAKLKEKNT